jgi:hypothetical protein
MDKLMLLPPGRFKLQQKFIYGIALGTAINNKGKSTQWDGLANNN